MLVLYWYSKNNLCVISGSTTAVEGNYFFICLFLNFSANGIYNASMILIVPSGISIDTLVNSMSENNLTGPVGAISKLLESKPERVRLLKFYKIKIKIQLYT